MTADHLASKKSGGRFSPVIAVIAFLTFVVLVVWALMPNFIRSGPGRLNGIINTLRQIDAAKQQWTYERGITNTVQLTNVLTEGDLSPYLSHGEDRVNRYGFCFDRRGRLHSGAGEKYVINPLNLSPEAQLTRDFKEGRGSTFCLPKGTVIRLSESGYEILLPDGSRIRR